MQGYKDLTMSKLINDIAKDAMRDAETELGRLT